MNKKGIQLQLAKSNVFHTQTMPYSKSEIQDVRSCYPLKSTVYPITNLKYFSTIYIVPQNNAVSKIKSKQN